MRTKIISTGYTLPIISKMMSSQPTFHTVYRHKHFFKSIDLENENPYAVA